MPLQEPDKKPEEAAVAEPPKFVPFPFKSVQLQKEADLDEMLKEKPCTITSVTFGRDFNIRDKHLDQLSRATGRQLTELRLGSSDTGDGVWVTESVVSLIVRRCPNLRVLQLESCTQLGNASFNAIIEGLPLLEELHITGHDRTSGRLKGKKLLDPLIKDNKLPELYNLVLTDQGLDYASTQRLIKARGKKLRVQAGSTDSDSFAYGCVLREMGGRYGDGLYGNW
ncbi:hypothetical protein HYH03_006570 [Edaphochlamys debaryana]|uniref:Uncharacterized protein n=1 Tax=Edaphochlamys debaryana TaxID=47281 RepID=A0A836C173_9CHLO|nr:hypothetical protein HYH03_006570 [Edaphochlamys debaryana]|eukprot:KAG2495298.1 hypothetical protein HYH03_006570 [Edaphochlamys debaryana]